MVNVIIVNRARDGRSLPGAWITNARSSREASSVAWQSYKINDITRAHPPSACVRWIEYSQSSIHSAGCHFATIIPSHEDWNADRGSASKLNWWKSTSINAPRTRTTSCRTPDHHVCTETKGQWTGRCKNRRHGRRADAQAEPAPSDAATGAMATIDFARCEAGARLQGERASSARIWARFKGPRRARVMFRWAR